MGNVFVISDTHFFHINSLKFTRPDGSPLRNFANVDEMNEHMVTCWNKVVGPKDKIYHLGDVCMGNASRNLSIMDRLNGDKVLIKGNHDIGNIKDYIKYFRDVRGSHVLAGIVFTHVPIHPQSLDRWRGNVHGHLHANQVLLGDHSGLDKFLDMRYLCVSVEQIDYTPISLEAIIKTFDDRKVEKHGRSLER